MKLFYIVNARMPTEKAHGYQIAKMCEEFAALGAEVELWAPKRRNKIKEDIFSFYGLRKNFKVKYIKTPIFVRKEKYWGKVGIYVYNFLFLISLLKYKIDRKVVIYTRDAEIGWWFGLKGHKVIYEAHNWPESKLWLYKFLLKKVNWIVCNSGGTEKRFRENGFKNTVVAPNGVDINQFNNIREKKEDLRRKFGLPLDKKIIMYIGHLYKWKGARLIIEAAKILRSEKNLKFVLIGGLDSDIAKYRQLVASEQLDNVLILGRKPKNEIPYYLKSADILLLPNAPIHKESIEYTSPIKMFEYMASRRLIIASRLPSIEEILNNRNAVFFKAGDAQDLAQAILNVSQNFGFYKKMVDQAYQDVQQYTWTKRAKKILALL